VDSRQNATNDRGSATKSGKRNLRAAIRAGAAGAVALALISLPGCKKDAAPQVEVTVQAAHPELGPIAEQIEADAILTPVAQAAIMPKIVAPVKKFYVRRGEKVHAGELLATLENADLQAAMMDNKGSLEAAEAAYTTTTKVQVPMDMQKAESDLAQSKANLDLNQSIVKSRKQLFAEGAIPGRDLDTAEATLMQAQITYAAAAKHLEALRAVSRATTLKAAQGQLISAQGKFNGAEALVDYSEIRSPIDGVVTDRPLFAGETPAAGAPLITVMDTSVLIAKTHIGAGVAQEMEVGDPATVEVRGAGGPVAAKVSMISPALDAGSTTIEVWLRIDNRDGALKAGTPVKVTVRGKSVARALKVPGSAMLTADDGTKSVMVVGSDGAAHRKHVTVGIVDGADVQVLSGVTPGDLVITGGAYALDEGTKVKIGPAEASGGGSD
jgi:multidrug efflux pump subunit AcrA (membrane-fusion protein)